MKKLNYLLSLVALTIAMGMVSCTKIDNPIDPDEPVVPEQKIHDGDELVDAIAQYTEVIYGVPTLNLPAGVSVVLTQEFSTTAPMSIIGDEANPAKIKISGDGKFVTLNAFALKNVIIDASELAAPLVTIGVADEVPEDWPTAPILFEGVTITNLQKALVATACKNYVVGTDVTNSNIQLTADVTTFDFTKGGAVIYLGIKKSTFWAPEATSKSFFSNQAAQKVTEYTADAVEVFDFQESTFYNLTKSKNFFTHRQSNQKFFTYGAENCIFVNCGKKGQVVKGMNQGASGANPTWAIKGNVFNFDGEDTSAEESTGDNDEPVQDSKAVVVNFADAANGDFTQSDANAGDPRWIK